MVLGKVRARGQVTLPLAIRRAVGPGTVEISVLPRLRLADLLERYPIEGPIDETADREQWEAVAAQDVFGERPE